MDEAAPIPDHDKYIEDITRSKMLFEPTTPQQTPLVRQEQPREKRSSAITMAAAIFIGFSLLLNLSLFSPTITGHVIQQDPVTKTVYVGFNAKLPKAAYIIGEPVNVEIDPPNATASIAVIAPDRTITMLNNLTYVPQQPGRYTMNVLLYMYGLSDRFVLQFEAQPKP